MKGQSLMCICMLLVSLAKLPAAEFHVAPYGNDAGPGTKAKPFATLERARDAVRGIDRRAGATIVVHGGVYELANTLVLNAADSGSIGKPVIWRAYRNEKPILRGGARVTGFVPHEGEIMKADLAACGVTNRFSQLFFDGQRQELARHPNLDPGAPFTSGWAFVDSGPALSEAKRTLRQAAVDAKKWARPTDGEVSIFSSHEWWNNIVPIAAFDGDQRLISLSRDCSYPILPGDRYFVRGLLEALDAPGEWYVDREQRMLYFWPPVMLESRQVHVPRLKTILELGPGVSHVTFQGLTFEISESTAVVVRNATNCLIVGCTVRNAGDYNGRGVSVSGGAGNGVVGCDVYDTGSHGISVGGGDGKTLTPAGNYAENNHVTRTGVFHKQGCGIAVSGVGNRVARNTLHHLPRFGVMFSGQNNMIELNHIHHVCLETMDTGAIYGGSINWLSAHGTVIRHNFIHDVVGLSGRAGKWLSPFFAWGIYLDWTAMGVTVDGNIVARAPRAGIMVHDGRDNVIENNIIVDCGFGVHEHGRTSQIECSGWDTTYRWWKNEIANWEQQFDSVADLPAWRKVASLRDPRAVPLADGRTMHHNAIRRNILFWKGGQALPFNFRNMSFEANACDSNLVWHGGENIRTEQFRLKSLTGPNIAPPNADFESGDSGKAAQGWTWHIRPSTNDQAVLCADRAHGGRGCLRISARPDPANKGKDSWAQIPSVKSIEVPVATGQVYCLVAWLRADRPGTRVEIGLQSYRAGRYSWHAVRTVQVGGEWERHELVARFPVEPPEMKSCYVRLRLPDGAGSVDVDDVELHAAEALDEWESWRMSGLDRHSLVADPRLANVEKDNYRLRWRSPAFKLGFRRIPVESIGCYHDERRASWPVQ